MKEGIPLLRVFLFGILGKERKSQKKLTILTLINVFDFVKYYSRISHSCIKIMQMLHTNCIKM